MAITNLPQDPTQAVWVALVRASTSVIAAVQADVKAAGFPPLEWYDVLWDLERAPGGMRRPFELEHSLLLAQYNLSRLIARLERAKLILRQPCVVDGRGQVLVITEEGKALRKGMWGALFPAMQRHIAARLSEAESRTLADLLSRLVDRP